MGGLSPFHMLIIFLVVLIIFGPKSIPQIARAFGKGIREFKEAARGISTELEDEPTRRPVTQVPPQQLPPVASEAAIVQPANQDQPTSTHQA